MGKQQTLNWTPGSANHAMWRVTACTDHTTVNVHIIAYLQLVRSGKKGLLEILDSHRFGTVLFPLNACCSWDQLNTLNPSYINDIFVPPSHFSMHPNQFSHPNDAASMFYWNFGTFSNNHTVMQTPNRSLSLYQRIRTYFYEIKVSTRQIALNS